MYGSGPSSRARVYRLLSYGPPFGYKKTPPRTGRSSIRVTTWFHIILTDSASSGTNIPYCCNGQTRHAIQIVRHSARSLFSVPVSTRTFSGCSLSADVRGTYSSRQRDVILKIVYRGRSALSSVILMNPTLLAAFSFPPYQSNWKWSRIPQSPK